MRLDLHGRTLGVVGTGRIGRRAIAIRRGFGMRVLTHDARPDPVVAAAVGFDYVPLGTLLAKVDAVTLHVPGEPGT